MLNVGWLDSRHDFPQGHVADEVLEKLAGLAQTKVNVMRGCHDCQFCSEESPLKFPTKDDRGYVFLGTGEIHVEAVSGATYSAPSLIVHYIQRHHYLPPDDFLEAVGYSVVG